MCASRRRPRCIPRKHQPSLPPPARAVSLSRPGAAPYGGANSVLLNEAPNAEPKQEKP